MAIPFDVILAFDSGSGALDATEFNAGVHGANWGSWTVQYTINHTIRADHTTTTLPFEIEVASTIYDGTQTGGATFDHSSDPDDPDGFRLAFNNSPTTLQSVLVVDASITNGTPENDYNCDLWSLEWAQFAVCQIVQSWNGITQVRAHTSGSNGSLITLPAGFVILVMTVNIPAGTVVIDVRNLSGTLVGTSTGTFTASGASITYGYWQDYLRYSGVNKTGNIKTKFIALRTDISAFPPVAGGQPSTKRSGGIIHTSGALPLINRRW
jgi:hypothetical protein